MSDPQAPHAQTPDPQTPDAPAEEDALLCRLRVIEDQPLATRAEALSHVHDELRAMLEAGDVHATPEAGDVHATLEAGDVRAPA